MSLLDSWNYEVTVYPDVPALSRDGNTMLKPAENGVQRRVMIQAVSSTESTDGGRGSMTSELYTLRFPRGSEMELGPRAVIDWDGQRWSIVGYPVKHNGSSRTRRAEYKISRS